MGDNFSISINTGRGGNGAGGHTGAGGQGGSAFVVINNYEREHNTLLNSLPRSRSAKYDSGSRTRDSCFQGTRKSVLEDIHQWVENSALDVRPIFWLSGLAGIGKSTIAQTEAERTHERGLLGASFFFSRGDAALTNPLMVFPTLAFQLAQFDETFKHSIAAVLEKNPDAGYESLSQQLDKLLIAPLHSSVEDGGPLVKEGSHILIILDALDECETQGAQELLQLLFSRISQLPFIRILITSRPELHIRSVFSQHHNHSKVVLHDIEASVVENDIRLYLESELAEIPKRLGIATSTNWPPSWPSEEDMNALVKKSGKLFVYAATAVRFIANGRICNPRKQLEVILGSRKVQNATPFADLDGLYLQLLLATLPESNPTDVQERFQAVVGSIILLRDPLPLDALARFVEYDDYEVSAELSYLHSVIIPPATSSDVSRIYHPSFRDFLTMPSRCSDARFRIITVPTHERRHTLRCFELMSNTLKQDIAGIGDASLLNVEVEEFERRVENAIVLEVRYACRFWTAHLSFAEHGDSAVAEALKEFSMRSMLWWFEAMSLIGSIPMAAGCILEARRWATNSKCEADVITMLSDAHRFVLAHGEVMRASALHVYHSALPFTPKGTLLYKRYFKGNDSIRVLQGIESDWSLCLGVLDGHGGCIKCVVFSPDGLRLASCSEDKTVRLWDTTSGANTVTLRGHSKPVRSVAFSPDGLRLASCSEDKTVRLWDTISGANTTSAKSILLRRLQKPSKHRFWPFEAFGRLQRKVDFPDA